MVSAPASAELGPGFVFVLASNRADRPIGVEDIMLASIFKGCADSKACLFFNGAREALLVAGKRLRGQIQNSHFHAASDVHADSKGNYCVLCGQHSADGKAITDMRIRH